VNTEYSAGAEAFGTNSRDPATHQHPDMLSEHTISSLSVLRSFHPLIIEGMGAYDPRPPDVVASRILYSLDAHWTRRPYSKPLLLVTQGDPKVEHGISAITSIVAQQLDVPRGLVCLDADVDPDHIPNAHRDDTIIHEFRFSQLRNHIPDTQYERLDSCIERLLAEKNDKRKEISKRPLADYFKTYALLQEVTKAGCFDVCKEMTLAHTADNISPFSVTSFYEAGIELGLYRSDDLVPYGKHDELDFESIDKR